MMWWIRPPRKAMSLPARICTWMSASALVREKWGSTWMILAPRSRAFITQRDATGWASMSDDPWIQTTSEFWKSC